MTETFDTTTIDTAAEPITLLSPEFFGTLPSASIAASGKVREVGMGESQLDQSTVVEYVRNCNAGMLGITPAELNVFLQQHSPGQIETAFSDAIAGGETYPSMPQGNARVLVLAAVIGEIGRAEVKQHRTETKVLRSQRDVSDAQIRGETYKQQIAADLRVQGYTPAEIDLVVSHAVMLPTSTACRVLGVTRVTLSNWRQAGHGPRYVKANGMQGSILYPLSEVLSWLADREVSDGGLS